jgi:aspartate kinase
MIVMKFGGTSVGTPERVDVTARIVKRELKRKPAVVVSAFGGVTNMLIQKAREALAGTVHLKDFYDRHREYIRAFGLPEDLIAPDLFHLEELLKGISLVRELTPRTLDLVQSYGERISHRIVAARYRDLGIEAMPMEAPELGFLTDSEFGKANLLEESYELIRKNMKRIRGVPVVTGYIAKDKEGNITTIGRSGSDYTATILGAAIGAEEVQIWTDVNGVMSADPGFVPEARSIPRLSFEEASELAYYGAKVLHPATIVPAVRRNIPVRVLNTFQPSHPGTVILSHIERSPHVIKSVTFKKNVYLITIASTGMFLQHGFLARIFEVFAHHGISIDMVATSEVTVSVTTDSSQNLTPAVRELSQFADVTVEKDMTMVAVVGEGIRETRGIAGKVFAALGRAGVSVVMISQAATKINISFLIETSGLKPAVVALHREFVGGRAPAKAARGRAS